MDIEGWLGRCFAEAVPTMAQRSKGKGRPRKTTVGVAAHGRTAGAGIGASTCSCAGQVVGYGVKKGWIRPVST